MSCETLTSISRSPFVAAFIAFAIAQITKLFTFYYTENRWDFTRVVGSGGMPSSHTSMVRSLLFAIAALQDTTAPECLADRSGQRSSGTAGKDSVPVDARRCTLLHLAVV